MFNFKGRINRGRFLLYIIVLSVISIVVTAVYTSAVQNLQAPFASIGFIVALIILIISAVAGISAWVRRLHDVNLSGFYAFLMIVPLVNIILGLYLLFKPGDSNPNQYIGV